MGMLQDDKEETITALLRAGFPEDVIPAIMGNIDVETGGSYKHDEVERNGTGYGLFQFTGSHQRDYFDWLKDSNLKDNKDKEHMDFKQSIVHNVPEEWNNYEVVLRDEVFVNGTKLSKVLKHGRMQLLKVSGDFKIMLDYGNLRPPGYEPDELPSCSIPRSCVYNK